MELFEQKYSENGEKTDIGAFENGEKVVFSVKIPRSIGAVSVIMNLSADGLERDYSRSYPLLWTSLDGEYDIYKVKIDTEELGIGLYYYNYEVNSFSGMEFYAFRSHMGELKKTDGKSGLIQLTVYEKRQNLPSWLFGGIMYHVFVDRFKKSGRCLPKADALMNEDWENGVPQYADKPGGYVENNMFFGGDLYGIVEKLDYIKSLGVNCIYLSPVFEAYSNHKYDTADYMNIDSMFGGEEAFELLMAETKKRDMHVILDGVFNHTGADSIYFNKNGKYDSIGAYQSKNSPYYDWYNFRSFPDDYECWWNVKILPRVNSDNETYRKFILGDGGVVEKWAKKGISGFRLDVADELSDDFIAELSEKLKKVYPYGVVYGEVWEDASNKIAYDKRKKYFRRRELDSVMNYPVRDALIKYIKYGDTSILDVCENLYSHYPKFASDLLMNVLGTHDTERILNAFGTENYSAKANCELATLKMGEKELKKAISMLKMAYTVIATLPGIPCIYYGDEAGMQGYRDPFNRMPYPWGRENNDLIEFYKQIGAVRRNEKLYETGVFKVICCTRDIFAFIRHNDSEFVMTVANRSSDKYRIISNYEFINLETNRKSTVVPQHSACIFKSSEPFYDADIEFVK